jgi:hypothetical protein
MFSEPHELFAAIADQERYEPQSRGWKILQKAFRGRKVGGPEADKWEKIMSLGNRHRKVRNKKRLLSTGFGKRHSTLTKVNEEKLKNKMRGNDAPKSKWATLKSSASSSENGTPHGAPTNSESTTGNDPSPKTPSQQNFAVEDPADAARFVLDAGSTRYSILGQGLGLEQSESKHVSDGMDKIQDVQSQLTAARTQEAMLLESITSEGFEGITPEQAKAALRDHGTAEKALDFLKVFRNGKDNKKFATDDSVEASLIDSEIGPPTVILGEVSEIPEASKDNKEERTELVDVVNDDSPPSRKGTLK